MKNEVNLNLSTHKKCPEYSFKKEQGRDGGRIKNVQCEPIFINRIHQNKILERIKLNRDRRNGEKCLAFHFLSVL